MSTRRCVHLLAALALTLAGAAGACSTSGAAAAGADSEVPPADTSTAPADTTVDWPRFGVDAGRSNVLAASTGIHAGNLNTLRRQQVQLDGTVDASPIYLHDVRVAGAVRDVFFLTTTYGRTLAVDADDGAVLWRYTPPGYGAWAGSRRITTATPVADRARDAIYAAAPDGRIRKLAVADGRELWSTAITKLPEREKIAASLNFFRGRVIAATGGYIGDRPPYQGHVAVLDAGSGRLLSVWNALCSDRPGLLDPSSCAESGAAIWGRAGVVVDSATGDLFVATGDGRWDGRTFWGDAVLELDPGAGRLLGNYTPSNTAWLDATDADVGSTAPALLGGDRVAQGGKDDVIRLLAWSRMRGGAAHRGGEAQSVPTPSGSRLFTAPAVLRAGGATWLIAADRGATQAWTLSREKLESAWKNGSGGTSPVVAGGLLYVYDPGGGLRVYEPTTGRLLATLDCGAGHWNSPIVVDGRIALPQGNANAHATTGVLNIWRLPDRRAGTWSTRRGASMTKPKP